MSWIRSKGVLDIAELEPYTKSVWNDPTTGRGVGARVRWGRATNDYSTRDDAGGQQAMGRSRHKPKGSSICWQQACPVTSDRNKLSAVPPIHPTHPSVQSVSQVESLNSEVGTKSSSELSTRRLKSWRNDRCNSTNMNYLQYTYIYIYLYILCVCVCECVFIIWLAIYEQTVVRTTLSYHSRGVCMYIYIYIYIYI